MYTAMNHELEKENCKIGKKRKEKKNKLNYITIMYTSEFVHVHHVISFFFYFFFFFFNPNFVILCFNIFGNII